MSVPTLVSVTPSTAFTGGMLVTLTGTNFRVPYPLPVVNGPIPDPLPTVQVLFDGVEGDQVRVYSATQLTVISPAHDPGTCSVTVKNLDVNGNPIAGEIVTLASALTFTRADLSIEADFTRVNRALIRLLKQQTISNVVMSTSVDYSDQAAQPLKTISIASLPCITVSPPSIKIRYGEYAEDAQRPEQTVGVNFFRRSTFRTVDVTWQLRVMDDNQNRALNLLTLLQQVLKDNTFLSMDRDPSDASKGQVDYEFYPSGEFTPLDAQNNSDVRVATGSVTLYGFWFEDIAGFPEQSIVEQGKQTESIVVSFGST